MPRVQLVLCRHDESIEWALNSSAEVIVYNNGAPLGAADAALVDERSVRNVGREAFAFVTHVLSLLSAAKADATAVPDYVVFSQAVPVCINPPDGVLQNLRGQQFSRAPTSWCASRLLRLVRELHLGLAWPFPNGFSFIDSARAQNYGYVGESRSCWASDLSGLLGQQVVSERVMAHLFGQLNFVPAAQFVVSRSSLISAPRRALRRAWTAMNRSRLLPWFSPDPRVRKGRILAAKRRHEAECCNSTAKLTCLPWQLERLWPVLLSSHRSSDPSTQLDQPLDAASGNAAAVLPTTRPRSYQALSGPVSEVTRLRHGLWLNVASYAARFAYNLGTSEYNALLSSLQPGSSAEIAWVREVATVAHHLLPALHTALSTNDSIRAAAAGGASGVELSPKARASIRAAAAGGASGVELSPKATVRLGLLMAWWGSARPMVSQCAGIVSNTTALHQSMHRIVHTGGPASSSDGGAEAAGAEPLRRAVRKMLAECMCVQPDQHEETCAISYVCPPRVCDCTLLTAHTFGISPLSSPGRKRSCRARVCQSTNAKPRGEAFAHQTTSLPSLLDSVRREGTRP